MLEMLIALLIDNPALVLGLDWLLKSAAVLIFALVISRLLGSKSFGARSQHMLWFIGLICLAVIPLISIFPEFLSSTSTSETAFFRFSVPLNSDAALQPSSSAFSSNSILILVYLIPSLLLLSRMVFALVSVFGMGSCALEVTNKKMIAAAKDVANNLGVSRPVRLLQSKEITSPFSYGIFSPKVILPEQADDWSESTLEDVLVHEFTHIRRFDWPTTLVCHFVASFYWINPLCWMAVNRISEEAENSCDAAVLDYGKSGTDYAKNLMLIARQSRDGSRLLTQMMADKYMLPKRVQRILNGRSEPKVNKMFLSMLSTVLLAITIAFSSLQILALEPSLQIQPIFEESLKPAPAFEVLPRFIRN